MNWKQTIGLVAGIGAIIAICFFVIFPALYGKEEPVKTVQTKKVETQAQTEEEDRSVLPKLKGVNWETAPQTKKPAEKKPAKKAEPEKPKGKVAKAEAEPEKSLPPEKSGPPPLLELEEMSWYEREGYVVVVGSVKNISKKSLPSVQAHVTFEGEGGWFISEEHAMIELNPIFPGQVSAFTVVSRHFPEITNAVVDFRKFSGESMPWSKLEVEPPTEEAVTEEGEMPPRDELAQPEEEVPNTAP